LLLPGFALAFALGRIVLWLSYRLTSRIVDIVFQTRWGSNGDYAGSELDANGDIVM